MPGRQDAAGLPGEGVHAARAAAASQVPKYKLVLGKAESLAVLQDEWAFFTPAILYLHGPMSDAPLADFLAGQPHETRFCWAMFDYPIFAGLEDRQGDPDWNRALWALPRHAWEAFLDHYCSVAIMRPQRPSWRIGGQSLDIVDPVARSRCRLVHDQLPLLPIMSFGINGPDRCLALQLPEQPWMGRPALHNYPVSTAAVVFDANLRAGRNPLE